MTQHMPIVTGIETFSPPSTTHMKTKLRLRWRRSDTGILSNLIRKDSDVFKNPS